MLESIIIVGAGAAGLAAARALTNAGISVIVLEGRDRIGGRIFSAYDETTARWVELGAEYVHGLPDQLTTVLDAAQILAVQTGQEYLHLDGNRPVADDDAFNYERVLEGMEEAVEQKDLTFAEYVRQGDFTDSEKKAATNFVQGFNAADAELISVRSLVKDGAAADAIHGDRQFRLTKPYRHVPEELLKECQTDLLDLRLGAIVKEIRWRERHVECILETGESISGRAAVITLPLAVLKSDTVQFSPPLQEKQEALSGLVMGQVQRITFCFKSCFWEELSLGEKSLKELCFLLGDAGAFATWWSPFPLRAPILVAWNSGPRYIARMSAEQLAQVALEKLSNLLGISLQRVQDQFVSYHMHDWRTDPFAFGSYSYAAKGGADASRLLSEPLLNTLFFAGEATNFEGHSATVHGAIATGVRAAAQLRAAL